jgi:hypothetical protein
MAASLFAHPKNIQRPMSHRDRRLARASIPIFPIHSCCPDGSPAYASSWRTSDAVAGIEFDSCPTPTCARLPLPMWGDERRPCRESLVPSS